MHCIIHDGRFAACPDLVAIMITSQRGLWHYLFSGLYRECGITTVLCITVEGTPSWRGGLTGSLMMMSVAATASQPSSGSSELRISRTTFATASKTRSSTARCTSLLISSTGAPSLLARSSCTQQHTHLRRRHLDGCRETHVCCCRNRTQTLPVNAVLCNALHHHCSCVQQCCMRVTLMTTLRKKPCMTYTTFGWDSGLVFVFCCSHFCKFAHTRQRSCNVWSVLSALNTNLKD